MTTSASSHLRVHPTLTPFFYQFFLLLFFFTGLSVAFRDHVLLRGLAEQLLEGDHEWGPVAGRTLRSL